MTPKVFISYSWTSPGHQARVRQWAEQLVGDGVDVVLDQYELKEGNDKYAFMERMVTDESVTHVLVMSDSQYVEKADARQAGVGTESQIISREIYEKVQQSKFIPIVCEFNESGEPYLPVFLKTRIWIDFSTPEAVNENWEQLLRVLYGKPAHEKPTLGKAPAYLSETSAAPASPAISKFNALRQAILQDRKGLSMYRRDFLNACIEYADVLRVRERPNVELNGQKVLEDCTKLKSIRNHIIDWVLLEAEASPSDIFSSELISFLERLLELKARPVGVTSWEDAWSEAYSQFIYETFLYIVAALLKTGAYKVLHEILTTHYFLPETSYYGENRFDTFMVFYAQSETLQSVLAPKGPRLYSPAAELIKRQADRTDLPFEEIIQADLLVLFMALITPETHWYPQTLHYASFAKRFPFFIRATQHRNYLKLATITGVNDAKRLRELVKAGQERLQMNKWLNFHTLDRSFSTNINLDNLDTIS